MAEHTLSILTPSVNNLSARIFVRAAGLDFEELDVWGKKDEPRFADKDPALLTPMQAKAAKDAEAALAVPLEVYREFFLDGNTFIGGDSPTIADIRLAATLEFLRAIDYDFPAWAEDYMKAVESALGEAYSEPAADVRGYVAQVTAAA